MGQKDEGLSAQIPDNRIGFNWCAKTGEPQSVGAAVSEASASFAVVLVLMRQGSSTPEGGLREIACVYLQPGQPGVTG
jgi:hypothetical protein